MGVRNETQETIARLDSLRANGDLATRNTWEFMRRAIYLIETLPDEQRATYVERVFAMDAVQAYAKYQAWNFLRQAAELIKTLPEEQRATYVESVFAMDAVHAYHRCDDYKFMYDYGRLIGALPKDDRAKRWAKILEIQQITDLANRNHWEVIAAAAYYIEEVPTSEQTEYVKNVLAMRGIKAAAQKAPDQFIKGVASLIYTEAFRDKRPGMWLGPVFAMQEVQSYARNNRDAFTGCVRDFMRFIPWDQIKESPTTVLYNRELRGSTCGFSLSAHKGILPDELIFRFEWHMGPIDRMNGYFLSASNSEQKRRDVSDCFRAAAAALKVTKEDRTTREQLLNAAWLIGRGRAREPASPPAPGAA